MKPAWSGLVSVPATRPVLEYQVRKLVQAIPNVTFLERHDILGLEVTRDRTRVVGARVQPNGKGSDDEVGPVRVLDATLVIDATGRGSRMPAWLEQLGY